MDRVEHVCSHNECAFDKAHRFVLIPVDGSDNSRRAFDWYVENVNKSTDGLYLIQIVSPSQSVASATQVQHTNKLQKIAMENITITLSPEQLKEYVQDAIKLNEDYLKICEEHEIPAKAFVYIGSKPGEQICRLARELNVETVIIGSRGLGTFKRKLFGSVSDYILHHAKLPLIVVPPLGVEELGMP